MSKYNVYVDVVLEMHSKGMLNKEISKELNLDQRRISDILSKKGLKANVKKHKIPNEIEKKVILGCVIGDGCLFKQEASKNYRMNLAHSLKQELYFMYKYNLIKDFIEVPFKKESTVDKRTKKTYHRIKFQTRVNEHYTDLYSKWYKNGKKIINKEFIHEIDDMVLAIKYFDDGYKNTYGYSISMNDYDIDCIKSLVDHIYENFNVKSTIQIPGVIYIPSKEREKFKKIIEKYATEDVLYKL